MSKFRTGYRAALTDVAEMLRSVDPSEVLPLDAEQLGTYGATIGAVARLTLKHAAYVVENMPSDHQVIEASAFPSISVLRPSRNYSGSTPKGLYDTPASNGTSHE